MEIMDLILQRRSIRKYTDEKLDEKSVENLLIAGMAAPTAMNLKPWLFIVVQEENQLEKLRKALPFGKINAPCAICVCGNIKSLKSLVAERFWVQDCSAATQNILLAASGLGLGSVWCGVYPITKLVKNVQNILDLPDGIIPLNIIFVGHSAESKPTRSQFEDKKVFFERYGQSSRDSI